MPFGPFRGFSINGTALAIEDAEVCYAQLDKNKSLRAGGFVL
jgi:hypothetical protein